VSTKVPTPQYVTLDEVAIADAVLERVQKLKLVENGPKKVENREGAA
jgi:hypothetical protein